MGPYVAGANSRRTQASSRSIARLMFPGDPRGAASLLGHTLHTPRLCCPSIVITPTTSSCPPALERHRFHHGVALVLVQRRSLATRCPGRSVVASVERRRQACSRRTWSHVGSRRSRPGARACTLTAVRMLCDAVSCLDLAQRMCWRGREGSVAFGVGEERCSLILVAHGWGRCCRSCHTHTHTLVAHPSCRHESWLAALSTSWLAVQAARRRSRTAAPAAVWLVYECLLVHARPLAFELRFGARL